ncbi:MAG: hypothetical protein ACJ71M_00830 [Nitrososphaeraceae archaeon]
MVLIGPSIIYGLENSNASFGSPNILAIATAAATSVNSNANPVLLDPNPSLIDKSGYLKNNDITMAANIKALQTLQIINSQM